MTNEQLPDIIEIGGVKYKRVEEPKPQTLLDIILEWWHEDWTGSTNKICEELVKRIEEWLPPKQNNVPEDVYQLTFTKAYDDGWNDCLKTIKGKLK